MSVLFVTAMYDLYNEVNSKTLPDTEKWSESWLKIDFRLKHLEKLLGCDVDILLFVQPSILPFIKIQHKRLMIVPLGLDNSKTYTKIISKQLTLPKNRNVVKDKLEYFALMNAKLDFMVLAKKYYPEFDHYAWIDGSIFKLFKNTSKSQTLIKSISNKKLPLNIISPFGDKSPLYPIDPINVDMIFWRFLGSIFIMPAATIDPFYKISENVIDKLILENKITWEINIWAIVETHYKRPFITYRSNHDDSILFLPNNIDSKEYGELNDIG